MPLMLNSLFQPRVAGRRLAVLVDAIEISPILFPVQIAAAFKFVPRSLHDPAAPASLLALVPRRRGFLAPAMLCRRHGARSPGTAPLMTSKRSVGCSSSATPA